ncbi:DUF6515 family protein [Mucilaginibacter aquaedulcis]|uniref:DUF6515 family protein n=1 Tax=Mucilaginibacter aquaedulcis TaxID=1187081 RepID=UPI0025B50E9A|nr:DUF6515 family protein [Mucilaginibacter aquaedulcis]MDN3551072.1 hypothetical protein [Mucilaginibacter aquaedulcis]
MKRIYKNLFSIALGSLLSLSLAFTANAQHRGGGGGGGGSTGGGGGGGGSRSSGGGGGGSFSRPSGSSFSRPSYNGGGAQRSAIATPQRSYGSSMRSNVTAAPQRTTGFAQRQTVGVAPGGNRVAAGTGARTYNGTRGYASVDRRAYSGGRAAYGNYGYGRRVYSGGGYGGRYGGRGGYFGSHYYYPYRNYYNSYYLPRLGFSIGFLPYGYYPFFWGDYQYYYSDGLYYRQYNDQYTVVEPPVGAEIKKLPSDAQSIMINGEQYYESNGVYYQPITKDDGTATYVIAGKDGELNTDNGGNGDVQQAPQIGDIVGQLPEDSRKIKINGEKLYVSPDGYYYQETSDNNGNKAYKIIGTPSDDPGDQGQQ